MNSVSGDTLLPLLRRLHKNHDAFIWNGTTDPDIVLMLRSNGNPDQKVMNFDLILQYLDENDVNGTFFEIFNLDPSMEYNDDDENFYIENFAISDGNEDEIDMAMVDHVASQLRTFTNLKTCGCGKYIIKDAGATCYSCMLSKHLAGQHNCGICLENISNENSLHTMPCCRQHFHSLCISKYKRDDISKNCPICRGGAEPNEPRGLNHEAEFEIDIES